MTVTEKKYIRVRLILTGIVFTMLFGAIGAKAAYTPDIEVTSNDPDTPTATLTMEGTGADYSLYEESFYQGFFESVDVLWVMDTSGSMSEEAALVQDYFDTFINQFVDLDLDYHLGITTTDMDFALYKGRLQGDPLYVTSEMDAATVTSTVIATISEIYAQGGSGSEQGLAAAQAALSEPLVSTDNAGFFRSTDEYGNEVALASIVVTDEEDDSSVSASSFSSWYNALKTDADKATFSAVCGDPADSSNWLGGCMNLSNGTQSSEAGQKYIDTANNTGGIWSSLCNDDYSQVLTHLSVTAAGMSIEFCLSKEPTSISDMTVTVDGAVIDYYSGYTGEGWKYETDTNCITFYGDTIPAPGATVYVSYKYDDGCE